jgi:hypothetical protein
MNNITILIIFLALLPILLIIFSLVDKYLNAKPKEKPKPKEENKKPENPDKITSNGSDNNKTNNNESKSGKTATTETEVKSAGYVITPQGQSVTLSLAD